MKCHHSDQGLMIPVTGKMQRTAVKKYIQCLSHKKFCPTVGHILGFEQENMMLNGIFTLVLYTH